MIRFGSIIIFKYVPDTSSVSDSLNGLTSTGTDMEVNLCNNKTQ